MSRMSFHFIALAGLICVSACSPSQVSTQVALTQTEPQAASPTAITLSDLDLEQLLIEEGALPAGFYSGQVQSTPPDTDPELQTAVNSIYRELALTGRDPGNVSIWLFEDIEESQAAFEAMVANLEGGETSTEVGEAAVTWSLITTLDTGESIELSQVVYRRCHALVRISIANAKVLPSAVGYAQRLDSRLTPLVCR